MRPTLRNPLQRALVPAPLNLAVPLFSTPQEPKVYSEKWRNSRHYSLNQMSIYKQSGTGSKKFDAAVAYHFFHKRNEHSAVSRGRDCEAQDFSQAPLKVIECQNGWNSRGAPQCGVRHVLP